MRLINQSFIMLYAFIMVACSGVGGGDDVWSNYDYLTPVPETSGVVVQPSDRIVPYYRQEPQDNDDGYVIPYQYGFCNDGQGMGCE